MIRFAWFIHSLRYSLTRFGKKRVSDEEFADKLMMSVFTIIPRHSILKQAGITFDSRADKDQIDATNFESSQATSTYFVIARTMFEHLNSMNPRGPHKRLHKSALFALDLYTRTLRAWANYELLISGAVKVTHWKEWHREGERQARRYDDSPFGSPVDFRHEG